MLAHMTSRLCLAPRNLGCLAYNTVLNSQEVIRHLSQTTELKPHSLDPESANFCKIENFLTSKSNPSDHTIEDVGLMYKMPKEDYKRLVTPDYNTGAFTRQFQDQAKSLNEVCMVVRSQGIELISYLKNTDFSAPINRYVIHGAKGSGKSMILLHAIHYCMQEGWLIIPNFGLDRWLVYHSRYRPTQATETLESSWNNERVDLPQRAVTWLNTFKLVNGSLLDNIKTSVKYNWSKHESSEIGTPFSAIVDFGQARVRVATDVIGAIMKEVRIQDESTMPKTLVTVDGVNSLFATTKLQVQHNTPLEASQLSFVHNLKKLLLGSWSNGAVIAALHPTDLIKKEKNILLPGSHPYDLLGQEGFDWLDPHVPILADRYTDEEILSQLAYYRDRKWISGRCLSEAGEAEMIQLSCHNPSDLAQICLSAY